MDAADVGADTKALAPSDVEGGAVAIATDIKGIITSFPILDASNVRPDWDTITLLFTLPLSNLSVLTTRTWPQPLPSTPNSEVAFSNKLKLETGVYPKVV